MLARRLQVQILSLRAKSEGSRFDPWGEDQIFKNKKGDKTMDMRDNLHYTNRINSLRSKGEEQNSKLIKKAQRNLRNLKKSGTN